MTTTTFSNNSYFDTEKSNKLNYNNNNNTTTNERSNSSHRSSPPYSTSQSNSPQRIHLDEQHDSDSIMFDGQFSKDSNNSMQNRVSTVCIRGEPVISLLIDGKERLCLAQISNTLLKTYSYNEIHNRRVALGINCIQCTPVQLEILRRTGAMPISSRRCGMITKREAERLVKSFLEDNKPPVLPDNFAFTVIHKCGWGCRGVFYPARYNSSRAKCIRCYYCDLFYSPNKFIFHAHNTPDAKYIQPDTANFNSWRRHLTLLNPNNDDHLANAWEDVKAIFNGGTRKRMSSFNNSNSGMSSSSRSVSPATSRAIDIETEVSFNGEENEALINNEAKFEDCKSVSKVNSDSYKRKTLSERHKAKKEPSPPPLRYESLLQITKQKDQMNHYGETTNMHQNSKELSSFSKPHSENLPFSMNNAKSFLPMKTEKKAINQHLIEPQASLYHSPSALSQFMAAAAAAVTTNHNYMPLIPSLNHYSFNSHHQHQSPHEQPNRHNIFPFWGAWNNFDHHLKLSHQATATVSSEYPPQQPSAPQLNYEQFLTKNYLSALNFHPSSQHSPSPSSSSFTKSFKIADSDLKSKRLPQSSQKTNFKTIVSELEHNNHREDMYEEEVEEDNNHQNSSKRQKLTDTDD